MKNQALKLGVLLMSLGRKNVLTRRHQQHALDTACSSSVSGFDTAGTAGTRSSYGRILEILTVFRLSIPLILPVLAVFRTSVLQYPQCSQYEILSILKSIL